MQKPVASFQSFGQLLSRRLFCAGFVVATLVGGPQPQAQVQQSWLSRYAGINTGTDLAYAIALDRTTNVYVFGPSVGEGTNGVSALVKYDSDGHQLWVARNSGAFPNYAFPNSPAGRRSLFVDAFGNVFLTGVFWPPTNNSPDIVTARYDRNGNKLWSTFFNSAPSYSYDASCALAVDSRSNIYVAGFSGEFAGTEDFVTIKYDAAGNQSWIRRYNGTGNSQDIPVAVAVDTAGNVHVTGWSFSPDNRQDYVTIKYDPDGNQLWLARYDGPFHSEDSPAALALDAAGSVYVSGRSVGSGNCAGNSESACADVTTVKYDANGAQLWVARHERLGDLEEVADIAVNSAGDVYVGASYGVGLIKYNANGSQLWASEYSGDVARAMILDASGTNAYMTGFSYTSAGRFGTARFDGQGQCLWSIGPSRSGNVGALHQALALDSANNVYVTGGSGPGDSVEFVTVKYAQSSASGEPRILTPPQNTTVAVGMNATFAVTASGKMPLLYHWLYNGKGSGIVSDQSTLTLSNLHVSDIGDWSVVVSNSVGAVASPNARLLVTGAPVFTAQFPDQTAYEGDYNTYFSARASGVPPLSFNWSKDGIPIGPNRNFLGFPNLQMSNSGTYVLVVTNVYGAVTSAPANLTVLSRRPVIVVPPQSQSVQVGESVSFNVSAAGQLPLRYQWQVYGNSLSAATNATLTIANAQLVHAGSYRVIVSNSSGSVTSAPVSLVVTRAPDNRLANTNSIQILDHGPANTYPSTIFVSGITGLVNGMTVTLDGLSHSFPSDLDVLLVGPTGASVLLMSDAGGGFSINNLRLKFDQAVGNSLPIDQEIASGSFRPSDYDGDAPDFFPSPAPGQPYGNSLSVFDGTNPNGVWQLYVVDSVEEDSGSILGGWSLDLVPNSQVPVIDPAALDNWQVRFSSPSNFIRRVLSSPKGYVAVGTLGTILTSPEGTVWTQRSSGTNIVLSGAAFGNGTFVVVGFGGTILTSTDGIVWTKRPSQTGAELYCVASSGGSQFVAGGSSGTVLVSSDSGATWQVKNSGTNQTFLGLTFGQGKFVMTGALGAIRVSTNGTDWFAGAAGGLGVAGRGIWNVAYGSGLFIAATEGGVILSSRDGLTWTNQIVPAVNNRPLLGVGYANDTFVCSGFSGALFSSFDGVNWVPRLIPVSAVDLWAVASDGQTFVVAANGVTNRLVQSDTFYLSAPQVVAQPRDTIVRIGDATNLNVSVVGTSPIHYQWRKGGTPLVQATDPVLVFSNVPASADGVYDVVVGNLLGTNVSQTASLRVGLPPAIVLQPLDQETVAGATVMFSVEANGTLPLSYSWRRPPSVYTTFDAQGSQSFWIVTNAGAAQVGIYGVVVSNVYGSIVSRPAQLTLAVDSDGDGLPDTWEVGQGLNPGDSTDANRDADGDGLTNKQEYDSGTNPTNGASALGLQSALTGGALSLTFEAAPGKTYTILRRESVDAGVWQRWLDFAARTNARLETVVDSVSAHSLFYKLVTPRQP